MRKVAIVKNACSDVKRVMIVQDKDDVYVFSFYLLEDGFCDGDEWYASVDEADEICKNEYGIDVEDWQFINDVMEGCQADWIAPVRIKGRNLDNPEWGKFERLENGIWKEITSNK